jgi:hypothetical protein
VLVFLTSMSILSLILISLLLLLPLLLLRTYTLYCEKRARRAESHTQLATPYRPLRAGIPYLRLSRRSPRSAEASWNGQAVQRRQARGGRPRT